MITYLHGDESEAELLALALDGVRAMLLLAGDDPHREGLRDTPNRVVKALTEMCEGLDQNPHALLDTRFGDAGYDEMVWVTDVPFTSLCEHHLLPFTGTATIGYLPHPEGPVVGLSKLPRMLHALARRPQVQERLTNQVASTLHDALAPRGVGVRLAAHHTCMSCRGVRSGGTMVTQTLLGDLRTDPALRAEFLSVS